MRGGVTPTPTFVGHGGMVTGNIPYPAGIEAGDLLIVSGFSGGLLFAGLIPSGWTNYNIDVINSTNSTVLFKNYGACYKIATGSESGTLTFGFVGTNGRLIMSAYRNVSTHSAVGGTSNNDINGVHTFPSITTTNNNALLVYQAVRTGDTNNEPFIGTPFLTNPDLSDITNRFNQRSTSGNGGGFGIATGVKESAGTVQSTSFLLNNFNNGTVLPWIIVLNPA